MSSRLLRLVLRLVPPDWRDTVQADLAEEAAAGRHGTSWTLWQAVRAAGALQWNGWTDAIRTDGVGAIRSLRRSPGFLLVAAATLALGVGGNTLAFSVVHGVLLRPLPYEDDGRLVVIEGWHRDDDGRRTRRNYSLADLGDWERVPGFESVALVQNLSVTLSSENGSAGVRAASVSDGVFATIRGPMTAGRGLGRADAAAPVAVVSARLWRDRLASAPLEDDLTIVLDDRPFLVVGVAAPSFQFPAARTDVWLPAAVMQRLTGRPLRRGSFGYNPVARLSAGVTLADTQANLNTLSEQLASIEPAQYGRMTAKAVGLRSQQVAAARPAIVLLAATFALIFAVACLNVAILFLTRAAGRLREASIRVALGATKRRLMRQALVESLLVVSVGGGAGIGLAGLGVQLLPRLQPPGLPRIDAIRLDTPVLLVAAMTVGLAAVTAALLPTAVACAATPLPNRPPGRWTTRRSTRARKVLVAVEVAVSVVLLVGAGLIGRSLVRLMQIDIGVPRAGTTMTLLELPVSGERALSDSRLLADRIVARVVATPGVEAAGLGAAAPPNLARLRVTLIMPDPASGRPVERIVDSIPGTPEFLPVLGVALASGRFFTAADTAAAPPVVILSTDLARRLFGEREPLGRTVPAGENTPEATVVGTVAPVRYSGLRVNSEGQLYQPWAQQPLPSGFLVARAVAGHDGMTGTIRRVLAEVDPKIVIASEESIESLVGYEIAAPRFHMILLSALALLSVTIAAVGLYGVVSQSVTQRTREIGIRMALGATSSAVARYIVLGGLRLAGVGLCIGVAGAWLVTRGLSAFLYGVSPADPLTYAFAAGFLLVIAALAAVVPARRAARIDPARSLRAE